MVKARFLRKGVSAPNLELLEVTLGGDLGDSRGSKPTEEYTFRVTRHGKVLIVSWQTRPLGEPSEDFAKVILRQMMAESILIFIDERGNSWRFTKELVAA